jgi:integral membrane protein
LVAVQSIKTFRYVALAEAVSFLVLLVAAVIKRTEDAPGGVTVMGPIHGLLFLAYVVLALNIRESLGWSTKTTALVLLGAVLPFGGFVVERWLGKSQPHSA